MNNNLDWFHNSFSNVELKDMLEQYNATLQLTTHLPKNVGRCTLAAHLEKVETIINSLHQEERTALGF